MLHSSFYNSLLGIRMSYLYFLTFLFICSGTGTWWYFLYDPAINTNSHLQNSIDQLQAQLNEFRKIEKTFTGISRSIDAQNTQKNSITRMRKSDAQQSLSLIADSAVNAGIIMESCKLCAAQQENSWGNIVSGDFKGSFDQIISFFEALKKSKQVVDVTQCTLVAHEVNTFCLRALFTVYCL